MKIGRAMTVDPGEFRSFCFRGEGRANFVFSAKNIHTGLRIVWRFAKARKSGMVTVKAKSELVNQYMGRMVAPFFDSQYLVNARIIEMKIQDVHHLAKLPSLPPNLKVETFEELTKLRDELSFLPLINIPHEIVKISALEMIDATRIPKHMTSYIGSTITIEIKPKQGFYQDHPGVNLPFCNNCILQLEKCGSDHYEEMYDFCPLELFSGKFARMKMSLEALFKVPHRNLRIFVDGNLVHSDEIPLDEDQFDSTLFPSGEADCHQLISALCLILSGNDSEDGVGLQEHSVLAQILSAQKIDPLGIVKAHKLFKELPDKIQKQLMDKTKLPVRGLEVLTANDKKSLVEKYLLAATMKDCSIMASLRLVPSSVECNSSDDDAQVIRLSNGLCFAYSVKIVDLDPKSPKNLLNAFSRFMAGVKIIRLDTSGRPPCVDSLTKEHTRVIS